MKTSKLFLFSVVIMIGLTNCASLTGPSKQLVKITSNPEGADINVEGRTYTTPAVVELKGKSEYRITATKDGYQDAGTVLNSKVRILASVVGNFFNLTGLVGMAIDFFATGAAYKLEPEVNVDLKKAS